MWTKWAHDDKIVLVAVVVDLDEQTKNFGVDGWSKI